MKIIFFAIVMMCGSVLAEIYTANGRTLEIPTPQGYVVASKKLRDVFDSARLMMGGSVSHRFVLFVREKSIDSTGLFGDTLSISLIPDGDKNYSQDEFSMLKKRMMDNSKASAISLLDGFDLKWCRDRSKWVMSMFVKTKKTSESLSTVRHCNISGIILIGSKVYYYSSQSVFRSEDAANELVKGIEKWLGEIAEIKPEKGKKECRKCDYGSKDVGHHSMTCGVKMNSKTVQQCEVEILKACLDNVGITLGDKVEDKIVIDHIMRSEEPSRKGLFWVGLSDPLKNRIKAKKFCWFQVYQTEIDLEAVWFSSRTGRIVSLEFGKIDCKTEVNGGLRSASWLQSRLETELGSKFELVRFSKDGTETTKYSLKAPEKGLGIDLTIYHFINLDKSAINFEIFSLDASLK